MSIGAPDSGLRGYAPAPSGSAAQVHAPESSVAEQEEISILDLLIVVTARRRMIFWITAAFAISAVIVSLVLPVRYTATVVLLPPQQNSSLGNQLAAQLGSFGGVAASLAGGGGLLKNPNDMYVAMFKSRTVEDAMIDRFGLMQEYHKKYRSDARKKFDHYATVDGSGKDGLIHISVEDHDPGRAAELANGYVDQYRNLSQNLAITEAQQRRQFFENQLKQANQNLADSEEALKETEQKTGLIQLDSQARALIESAAALRAQIAAKEVQIQGMQTYATGENAQLAEAEQELTGLRAQLAKLGGGGDNPDNIIVPKGQMTTAGLEYVRRLRDVKYYETIFDILARQFELAKLDEAKEGAIIQVVDLAVVPDKRSFPKRALIVIVSTVVGSLFAIFAALFRAAFDRMKVDPKTSSKLDFLRETWSGKLGRKRQV
jgi:tyrosine-protein kinase Etk/Wzc